MTQDARKRDTLRDRLMMAVIQAEQMLADYREQKVAKKQ